METRKKTKSCSNCAFFLFSLDKRKRKRRHCAGVCVWGTTQLPVSVESLEKNDFMYPNLLRDNCPIWKDVLQVTPTNTKDVEIITYSCLAEQKYTFVLKKDDNVYFEGGQKIYIEKHDSHSPFRQLFTLMNLVMLDCYRIAKIHKL